jgi:hypothetical protein
MKFNFNITRIRFRAGSGQRGESWMAGICIPRGKGALNGERGSQLSALSSQDATLIPSRTLFIRPFRIRPSSFVLSSILRNTRGSRSCSSFAMNNWVSSSSREPRARRELRKFLAGVASFAFCDIAGNRYGCSSHLGGKAGRVRLSETFGWLDRSPVPDPSPYATRLGLGTAMQSLHIYFGMSEQFPQ